jgi:hypothetical protein
VNKLIEHTLAEEIQRLARANKENSLNQRVTCENAHAMAELTNALSGLIQAKSFRPELVATQLIATQQNDD